jgi:hypothetical protein
MKLSGTFVCRMERAQPLQGLSRHELLEEENPIVALLLACRSKVKCLNRGHQRQRAIGLIRW